VWRNERRKQTENDGEESGVYSAFLLQNTGLIHTLHTHFGMVAMAIPTSPSGNRPLCHHWEYIQIVCELERTRRRL
jgi:hypothetical protein